MTQTVKLIGITNPTLPNVKDANELIAFVARVSNPQNQNNTETAPKLLNYLIKNNHWSPFEMVHVLMEITTTRDISRQILRHRSFSFQEFSQRYAVSEVFTLREARLQDVKNRQNSIENEDIKLEEEWRQKQFKVSDAAINAYKWALENGIAKEQARVVLPEGNTMTTLYMGGTLRSWLHYVMLRADKATQKEHREIASKALDIIVENFPSLADYLVAGQ